MPLAPPGPTTPLPFPCIAASRCYSLSGQDEVHHRRVVTGRAQQDETMPDHVLEAQPPPGVKDHPEAVERPAGQHEPEVQGRQRTNPGIIEHPPAPAEREGEPRRQPVEPAGACKL